MRNGQGNPVTENAVKELQERIESLELPLIGGALGDYARVEIADQPRLSVSVQFAFPAAPLAAELDTKIRALIDDLGIAGTPLLAIESKVKPHAVRSGMKPLPGAANIIAVASGKGGVGKSTTAVNIALALSLAGARVGILDADIYGPSQPRMLGLRDAHPVSHDGTTMEPLTAHGVETMSIGFLVDEKEPMVWRGPMVTQALNQILTQTNWGNLDYLIVDMPPGTGDIQLTLSQRVPVSGALIVTTPQDIALLDAHKGLKMFEKVGIPVLGIIENMSTHICSGCGHEEAIFGSGGGARLGAECNVPVLGQLPLDLGIREQADGGHPSVAANPDGPIAQAYLACALRMAAELSRQRVEHAHKFPNIVVENS